MQEWEDQCSSIIMEALRGKFLQNEHLSKYLRDTFPLTLGEASQDPVWGIGHKLFDDHAKIQDNWLDRGNLLGRSLMEIRNEIIESHPVVTI